MLKRKKVLSAFIITASIATTGVTGFALEPVQSNESAIMMNQEIERTEATAKLSYTGQIAWHDAEIEFKVQSKDGYAETMNGKNIKIQGVTLFGSNKVEWNGNGITIKLKDGTKLTKSYLNELLNNFKGYPEGIEKIEVTSMSRENAKASSVRSAQSIFNGGSHSISMPLPDENDDNIIPARFIRTYMTREENKIIFEFDSSLNEEDLNLISGDEFLWDSTISIEDGNKIVIAKRESDSKFDLSNAPKLVIGGDNPCDLFIEKGDARSLEGNIKLTKVEKDAVSDVTVENISNVDGVEFIEAKEAYAEEIYFNNFASSDTKIKFTVQTSDEQKEFFNGKMITLISSGGLKNFAKWTGNELKVTLGSGNKSASDLEELINKQLPQGIKVKVEFTGGRGQLLPHAEGGRRTAHFNGGVKPQAEVQEQLTVGLGLPRTTARLNINMNDGTESFEGKVLVNKGDDINTVANKVVNRLNATDAKNSYDISKDENANIIITQKGQGKNVELELTVN